MSDDLRLGVALNGYGVSHHEPDGGWTEILPWSDLLGLARLGERLGYEAIFTPEIWGREAFSTLAGFATTTERIRLVSGVLRLSSREVTTLAMGASSLHEMSTGRFILGLGSDRSLDRTRELVRAIRSTIDGDEGLFTNEVDGVTNAAGPIDWYLAPREVAVYLAALGPRMTELAAEIADGVILNWCTPERVAEARAAAGARTDFTIAVYVRACLSHVDEHSLEALQVAAARYIGLEPYAKQLERIGFVPEVRAARAALGRGAHPREAVPESLVNQLCVRGDRDLGLRRLREYRDAGADVVVVYPVAAGEAVSSITGTMMALAPDPALEG